MAVCSWAMNVIGRKPHVKRKFCLTPDVADPILIRMNIELQKLKSRRAELLARERYLDDLFWQTPSASTRHIEAELDEVCEELDRISDQIGKLDAEEWERDSDTALAERLSDIARYNWGAAG
jgi:hypothetical protein